MACRTFRLQKFKMILTFSQRTFAEWLRSKDQAVHDGQPDLSYTIFLMRASNFFHRKLDLRYGIGQVTLVVLDVDLAIRTDDLISVGIDPLEQGGMTLGKLIKITLMNH